LWKNASQTREASVREKGGNCLTYPGSKKGAPASRHKQIANRERGKALLSRKKFRHYVQLGRAHPREKKGTWFQKEEHSPQNALGKEGDTILRKKKEEKKPSSKRGGHLEFL